MREVASPMQLRMSFLRWALFIVPLVVLLGFISGQFGGSGDENRWFMMLDKPAAQPPGWAFGLAWTILYILMGIALTLIVTARGAKLRGLAIGLFAVQFILNLIWSPLFFGMHQVTYAFYLIVLLFFTAFATTMVFGRIRSLAAWLMVPYLAWLCFAAVLNKQIDTMNPDAETMQAPRSSQSVEI